LHSCRKVTNKQDLRDESRSLSKALKAKVQIGKYKKKDLVKINAQETMDAARFSRIAETVSPL